MKFDQDQLGALLTRLNRGDLAAAEEVFVKYEPYLRLIVRRQLSGRLRAKFDSSDIVQSVWADLVVGFRDARWHFDDSGQLRAFLVKVTRNRYLDRLRQQRASLRRERPLTAADIDGMTRDDIVSPSQQVQVDELWQDMVNSCPPQHRVLLEMKRQGKSLAEIAAETGYHESSIRRILYEMARRFVSQRRRKVKRSRRDRIGGDPASLSPELE